MNEFNKESRSVGARQIQKETTAKAIIKAAKQVFETVGFEKANIRDIAKLAGVAPGSVIHHFGNKKVLLHSALFDDLEKTLTKALNNIKTGSLEERLSKLTESIFKYYQKRPKLSRTLLKESLFAEEPWSKKFSQQTGAVHTAIVSICEEAKNNKEITKEVDSSLFAVSYLSFFYFALIAWVQGANKNPVTLAGHLVSQYISLLKLRREK
ncbi:MAG: TetR/AcrR family transcriptional regulator [Leptospirales bacterium]